MKLKHTLLSIFVISLVGMIMSLYFGYFGDPIANIISGDLWNTANALIPCTLCRYGRIMLYPMVIISAIAYHHKDKMSLTYLKSLAIGGVLITGYQVAMQAGVVSDNSFCIVGSKSCAVIEWQYFGVTIPMLALASFVLIILLIVAYQIAHTKPRRL